MPSDKRRVLGAFGESAAVAHLVRRGATIIARNWRCPRGEIDLVARLGGQVVFVEVRTRRSDPAPEASLSPAKRRRLATLAYAYLQAADLPLDCAWRIDLIAVVVDRSGLISRLSHVENAIEAE